jgi:urea carboxylase-associated protein 2
MSETNPAGPDFYRERYRALKHQAQERAAAREHAALRRNPDIIPAERIRIRETIPGGWYWSSAVARGETLRILNPSGRSSVALLLWNRDDTAERLNPADTIKIQWTARLAAGRVLFSDMGRVLASITDDRSGRHDALSGGSNQAGNRRKYGDAPCRNTRDNFLLGTAKLGLGPRDVGPCISLFAPIATDAGGKLVWEEGVVQSGCFVDLRAEMNLLTLLSTCPHPLDPAPSYDPQPVEAILWRADPPDADDYCRTATEETIRGFENTDPLFVHG